MLLVMCSMLCKVAYLRQFRFFVHYMNIFISWRLTYDSSGLGGEFCFTLQKTLLQGQHLLRREAVSHPTSKLYQTRQANDVQVVIRQRSNRQCSRQSKASRPILRYSRL